MLLNDHYYHNEKVQSWVKELKKMLGSDISLVIAGNKVKMNKRSGAFSLAIECHLENFLN